jgi:hypothetical protein
MEGRVTCYGTENLRNPALDPGGHDLCFFENDEQGFNPGLGNSRRCALKGHHNPARQYRIEIIRACLFMLTPLSGRIFWVAVTQG